jgi:predicted amidohydrolase
VSVVYPGGSSALIAGDLVGKYRKLHMYDVDIPGGIVMKESDVITPGTDTLVYKFRALQTINEKW